MSDDEFYECEEEIINPSNISILGDKKNEKSGYDNYYIDNFKNTKNFISKIQEYDYNSPTNNEHIKSIERQLKKDPMLSGVFTTISDKNNNLMLIDGHHRIQALKNLIKKDYKLNVPLDIHNYKCNDFDDDDVIKLFEKINNTKPFRTSSDIVKSSQYIINKIKSKIPKLFSYSEKRANFPRIHTKTFNDELQNYLKKSKKYNEDIIISNILNINDKLSKYTCDEFIISIDKIKSYKSSKIKSKYETIKKLNCFIGCIKIENLIKIDF